MSSQLLGATEQKEVNAFLNALPRGRKALVTKFGHDQLEAIENSVQLMEQDPVADFGSPGIVQPGDVIVKVMATEIVWTDTVMATGQYQHQPRLPYAPGMIYAGIVAFATSKAQERGVKPGSKVIISGNTGARSLGRYQGYGGTASYALAPWNSLRYFAPNWTFAEAAASNYGYDTAYHCLHECGKIQPRETILIHGATGGVGIPAVHLAVLHGLTVIATTRSVDKVNFLKSLGVTHVIVLKDRADSGGLNPWFKEVKQITGGKGVDVVYDGVGGDGITVESMKALKFGGRLLIVGWASTPDVAKGQGKRGAPKANRIPTNLIMMKSLQVIGCPAMIAAKHDKTLIPRRAKFLSGLAKEGKLPPPTIAEHFPLDDVKQALRSRVASGGVIGSTIVCPHGVEEVKRPRKSKL